jgi:hypothetical protein
MKSLEQLMDERHAAYTRTKATDFDKYVEEWRDANRAYVLARRDAAQDAARNLLRHASRDAA